MRIAVLSTPFIRVPPAGYGGTELFCWELSEELAARGLSWTELSAFLEGIDMTRMKRISSVQASRVS